ncbi:uncharacterized protein LOC118429121 [Branchiostoma floridae]|uniref:Uncharacterized protein LOC118429121 n=1 Tax=Branchiostoma floridae TaxID=7739 RepID=A0A9J7N6V2_BRAFL|nr:uncharacterized protein LOC118429121 [Branchiostoma floridae]
MAINLNILLCVMLLMPHCLDVLGRSVPSCEGGKVWNVQVRTCECPLWTYWYQPTHGCEPCSQLCRGEVSHCEDQSECQGYLQSLTSTLKPVSTESSWTVSPAGQNSASLTELTTVELAVIFIGLVVFILVLRMIFMEWTLCKLKKQVSKIAGINAQPFERQSLMDHTWEKQRYEPDGALTEQDRGRTGLQPDTQETEESLPPGGAQCARVVTSSSPSDDDVQHSPTSDTKLHKPSVNGDMLQEHHDAVNADQ